MPPVVVITAYVATGLGIELFNVPWFTATQREVAPDKLARVSSLDFLLSYGLAPLGLVLIPPPWTRSAPNPSSAPAPPSASSPPPPRRSSRAPATSPTERRGKEPMGPSTARAIQILTVLTADAATARS